MVRAAGQAGPSGAGRRLGGAGDVGGAVSRHRRDAPPGLLVVRAAHSTGPTGRAMVERRGHDK